MSIGERTRPAQLGVGGHAVSGEHCGVKAVLRVGAVDHVARHRYMGTVENVSNYFLLPVLVPVLPLPSRASTPTAVPSTFTTPWWRCYASCTPGSSPRSRPRRRMWRWRPSSSNYATNGWWWPEGPLFISSRIAHDPRALRYTLRVPTPFRLSTAHPCVFGFLPWRALPRPNTASASVTAWSYRQRCPRRPGSLGGFPSRIWMAYLR